MYASTIPETGIGVQDARDGKFIGGEIPADLRRQWIQGTGPATKPNAPVEKGIRNVAYALLSGADGWMFDGEDALGPTSPWARRRHCPKPTPRPGSRSDDLIRQRYP